MSAPHSAPSVLRLPRRPLRREARPRASGVLLVLLLSGLFPAAAQVEPWRASGGRVALHLAPGLLQAAGLELTEVVVTASAGSMGDEEVEGELLAFRITEAADLLALRDGTGQFVPYGVLSGSLPVDGGFALVAPDTGAAVSLHGLSVGPRPVRTDGPGGLPDPAVLHVGSPALGDDAFRLAAVKTYFATGYDGDGSGHHQPPVLVMRAFDLLVTDALAAALRRPDLAGRLLGWGRIDADMAYHDGPWEVPSWLAPLLPWAAAASLPAGGAGVLSTRLSALHSLRQVGHEGAWPDGRVGLSLTTTICNDGEVDVPWEAPMSEAHPAIVMALYRVLDGRLEQIGQSWVKHGFFAASASACAPCSGLSGGVALAPGCSDTYGTANNGDRHWLGPRAEWDAYAAAWTCLGSYFDGLPVDCVRDEDGDIDDEVLHRLEAADADLGLPGATYYYEARYLVAGDVDPFDDVASRRATFTWTGDFWQVDTPNDEGNPLVPGPVVTRWGDSHASAGLHPWDGEVVLAVDVRNVAYGQWRYEYALHNFSLDRRARAFSLPLSGPAGQLTFHDVDGHEANDWVDLVSHGNLSWTFPDVAVDGHLVAGPLEFGTTYSFGFLSNRPPAARHALVTVHEPGPGGDLLAVETLAPAGLALAAVPPAPPAGGSTELLVRGGTGGAVIALLAVDGLVLDPPVLLAAAPLPFVGGEARVEVVVPAEAAGLSFTLLAGEVGGAGELLALSNLAVVAPF